MLLPGKRCDRVITATNGVPQRAADVWPAVIRVIDGLGVCVLCVRACDAQEAHSVALCFLPPVIVSRKPKAGL